jgi:GNAT superfamily N-acetyltransferase
LSAGTWGDFEKLFLRKSKGGGCWCMIFHQLGRLPKAEKGGMTRGRAAKSRREKRALVKKGTSHGILVYANAGPVGWCQYGPREELPRIDAGTIYRRLAIDHNGQRLWRITCFWVDRTHRTQGVARTALAAALESIGKKGGGLVEAYPAKVKGFPADWTGTLSMFRKEGFDVVAPYGKSNVLVRRTV